MRSALPWVYSAVFFVGLGLLLALHEYALWMPERAAWPWALRDGIAEFGMFAPLTPPLFALVRKELARPRSWLARAGALTALWIAFAAVHVVLQTMLVRWLPTAPEAPPREVEPLLAAIVAHLERDTPYAATRYVAIFAVAIALSLRRAAFARELEARALRQQFLQAQLQALRAQLQPHFLFNTLHAVGVAARTDPDTASRMVVLLGDVLRGVLQTRADQLVPLREELALLRPYLELLALRYRDRLTVAIDVPAELHDALVPDLLLQPMVENAVRHGIEARAGAGRIEVRAERSDGVLAISVRDDGLGPTGEPRDGTGLGNTRGRLAALYGDAASLALAPASGGGAVATVRLPWRDGRGEGDA